MFCVAWTSSRHYLYIYIYTKRNFKSGAMWKISEHPPLGHQRGIDTGTSIRQWKTQKIFNPVRIYRLRRDAAQGSTEKAFYCTPRSRVRTTCIPPPVTKTWISGELQAEGIVVNRNTFQVSFRYCRPYCEAREGQLLHGISKQNWNTAGKYTTKKRSQPMINAQSIYPTIGAWYVFDIKKQHKMKHHVYRLRFKSGVGHIASSQDDLITSSTPNPWILIF